MNSQSEKLRTVDRRYLWHPYSRHSVISNSDFPVMVRGEGVYLFDSDGRRYLDAISSWWACNLGHSHPRLIQALLEQGKRLQHSILANLSHPGAILLAERLVKFFLDKRRRVFFAGDGASAVEAALKMAVQYWSNLGHPERHSFVALENAYHGDTLGAVAVGYQEQFHAPFRPLLFPVLRAPSPCCGTCARGPGRLRRRHRRVNLAPDSCEQVCLAELSDLMAKHATEIAAVIVEPLCQAAAGMRIYSADCLKKIAALCQQHDILLIADEIAVGFGRTGSMFAFQHAGIEPDIVCLGKGLAGGYLPMSATIVREELYETFADQPTDHTFYSGHTFAGNPLAAAVALETLSVYEEDSIVEYARVAGRQLLATMAPLRDFSGVRDVRGLGMLVAVELADRQGKPDAPRAQRIAAALLKQGILIRPLGAVVYLMPPLITPEVVLSELADQVRQALAANV